MLLCLRDRFLFVHIAKTGGTSVRVALARRRWRDPWFAAQFVCSRLSHLTGHRIGSKFPRHAKVIAAKEMLPRELFDSLFKFAFVRNPWDLQVSSYHHIRRERPDAIEHVPDFASFLRWKLDSARPRQYHLDMSMELQHEYLVDLDGSLIVDYVGRYERLVEDYEEICRRIGIPARPLPHKRKAGDRREYRSYYDDATADLVARHYRRDIEDFGYEF